MEVLRNYKLKEAKKPVKRIVAVNASWKAVLTEKGLEIRGLLNDKKLRMADLNYPKMVEVVMNLVEDCNTEAIENLVDDYVDLLDILEQAKEYIKKKTYENVKCDLEDVLSLIDEGNEWTEN